MAGLLNPDGIDSELMVICVRIKSNNKDDLPFSLAQIRGGGYCR
jgi:hypothetical protein